MYVLSLINSIAYFCKALVTLRGISEPLNLATALPMAKYQGNNLFSSKRSHTFAFNVTCSFVALTNDPIAFCWKWPIWWEYSHFAFRLIVCVSECIVRQTLSRKRVTH